LGEYTPTPSERLFSRRLAKGKILLRQYREFFKMKNSWVKFGFWPLAPLSTF
jgi:hypothetical protein